MWVFIGFRNDSVKHEYELKACENYEREQCSRTKGVRMPWKHFIFIFLLNPQIKIINMYILIKKGCQKVNRKTLKSDNKFYEPGIFLICDL